MNISDKAVEAAAKAMLDRVLLVFQPDGEEVMARAALKAAAPHLMAQAWDQGYEVGGIDERVYWRPNPYRSAGAGE